MRRPQAVVPKRSEREYRNLRFALSREKGERVAALALFIGLNGASL